MRVAGSRWPVASSQWAVASSQLPVPSASSSRRKGPGNWQLATGYFIVIALMLAPQAFACSVCYGAPGDPLVKGANNGILFLLAVVALVQVGFIAMFWSFWRRARDQRRFRESLRVLEGGPRS